MNLKLIYQKLLLAFINLLYYPNILGYYSDNDMGGEIITTKDTIKYRHIGNPNWGKLDETVHPRLYNENITRFAAENISIKTLWHILTRDWVESKIFFAFGFLLLETIALLHWTKFLILGKPSPSLWSITEINVLVTLIFTAVNAFIQFLMRKRD